MAVFQNEAYGFGDLRDSRVVVQKSENYEYYYHVLRVEVTMPCCSFQQVPGMALKLARGPGGGTCFFIKVDEGFLYFLTAAHVLFCPKRGHGQAADTIELYVGGDDGPLIATLRPGLDGSQSDGSYAKICPAFSRHWEDEVQRQSHDYGIIRIALSSVKLADADAQQAFKRPKFHPETRNRPLLERISRSVLGMPEIICTVIGFPGNDGAGAKRQKNMFKSSGEITFLKTYKGKPARLWEHRIHTDEGQSGAPVFRDVDGTVFGIHIGHCLGEVVPVPSHNLAVVIDDRRVQFACGGFEGKVLSTISPIKSIKSTFDVLCTYHVYMCAIKYRKSGCMKFCLP